MKEYLEDPLVLAEIARLADLVMANEPVPADKSPVAVVQATLKPAIKHVLEHGPDAGAPVDGRTAKYGARIVLAEVEGGDVHGATEWQLGLVGLQSVWEFVEAEARSIAEFVGLDEPPAELSAARLGETKEQTARVYMSRNKGKLATIRIFFTGRNGQEWMVRLMLGPEDVAREWMQSEAQGL